MLTATQKRKENIIEFLLYMYQIEEIVRGFSCDIEKIKASWIPSVLPNPSFKTQYEHWYGEICSELKRAGKTHKGHLYELEEVFTELTLLHRTLLEYLNDAKYKDLFSNALTSINEFSEKSSLTNAHPIEVCLHAMYMKWQLKLRKQEISAETEEAMDSMRILLAYLAREYKKMKTGEWGMNMN